MGNTAVVGTANVGFDEVTGHITVPEQSTNVVPEPTTLLLLGVAGLAAIRRRRK